MTRTSATETLAERMKRTTSQVYEDAEQQIAGLAEVAADLHAEVLRSQLDGIAQKLISETFKLILMGRFKMGKSCLLNALLGGTTTPVHLGGVHGPMVVDDLPCTAVLTGVHYSEKPYIKAWHIDGKGESWRFDQYLSESMLEIDEEETQRKFGHIREFEMGFPSRLCQAGVVVYDSPGLDEFPLRDALTKEASRHCDAAIVVYRSDILMGHSEMMDHDRVVADGTRVFTVVNLRDDKVVDDRLRGFVWNKLVRDHLNGPKWDHQDLATHDIYFVQADWAREGVYTNQPGLVARSGITTLEQRLGDFLANERQVVHLNKFATQAQKLAADLVQQVDQRSMAVLADQERLLAAAEAAGPKLEAIRAQAKRLAPLIDRYRDEASRVVRTSWIGTVTRLREELPAHVEQAPLPSAEKLTKVMMKKRLQQECDAVIASFVAQRIESWANVKLPHELEPVMQRMQDDISSEVTQIGREFDAIHLELTGWSLDVSTTGPILTTAERVLSAAAGLLFGDLSAAVTGGAGGWRGAAGGISGALGMGILLTAVGVTSAVAFLPLTLGAAAVAGLMSGGTGIEKKVKEAALKTADSALAEMGHDVEPAIAGKLTQVFQDYSDAISAEVDAVIDSEISNVEEIIDINHRDQGEKRRLLEQLEDCRARIGACGAALTEVLTTARQIA